MQDHVDAKVVVAGLSTTCSQKIHNQLVWNFVDIFLIIFSNTKCCLGAMLYAVILSSLYFLEVNLNLC